MNLDLYLGESPSALNNRISEIYNGVDDQMTSLAASMGLAASAMDDNAEDNEGTAHGEAMQSVADLTREVESAAYEVASALGQLESALSALEEAA